METKRVVIVCVVFVILVVFGLFLGNKIYFDDIDLVVKKGDVEWADHTFSIAKTGNVEFVENGFKVFGRSNNDDGLATSKLVDVNMNQRIKVTVVGDFEGKYVSGEWSEFAIYLAEKDAAFFDKKAGIALLGSRDNVAQSDAPRAGENVRDEFKFEWFSVENTGDKIIIEDSSGRVIEENRGTEKSSSHNVFERLDSEKEWNIRINSHVKGEGETSLNVKEIIVEEN